MSKSSDIVMLTGINGKPVAIDMPRIEMVEFVEEDETHIHTSSDWYKVRDPFNDVLRMWRATK